MWQWHTFWSVFNFSSWIQKTNNKHYKNIESKKPYVEIQVVSKWILKVWTYRPVFVMIISVSNSLNLSHNSLVSRWHWMGNNSSQLQDPLILGCGWLKEDIKWFRFLANICVQLTTGSGEELSRPSFDEWRFVWWDFRFLGVGDSSTSLHSSTSTSTSG